MRIIKLFSFFVIISILIGLPMGGVLFTGKTISLYLEFPPKTQHVAHADFSWSVFIPVLFFNLFFIGRFVMRIMRIYWTGDHAKHFARRFKFPIWGWGGISLVSLGWIIAWNRFTWFSAYQAHTFIPLWVGYIVTINAFTFKRKGACLLQRGKPFLVLFLVSSIFWWFFEYLNRFVQNWFYVGVSDFSSFEYFVFASISFSTVLPAVISTKELLDTFPIWKAAFSNFHPFPKLLRLASQDVFRWLNPLIAVASLFLIGIYPNFLFPLVWISPLLLLMGFRGLNSSEISIVSLNSGIWTPLATSATAALICGFFWELWNYHSAAKWIYSIPFVNRFHIFEMPLLGYAGYIPFGWECLVISEMALKAQFLCSPNSRSLPE